MNRRTFIISTFMLGLLTQLGIPRDKTIEELLATGRRTPWGYVFDRSHSQKDQGRILDYMFSHLHEFRGISFVEPGTDFGTHYLVSQ